MPKSVKFLALVGTWCAVAALSSSLSAGTVLLSDNFNTSGDSGNTYPNNDVNIGITDGNPNPGRQTGTLAPLAYNSSNGSGLVQVGSTTNPNTLQLTSSGGNGNVSPNHDFINDASIGRPLEISFNVNPVAPGSDPNAAPGSWASLNFLTASQNPFVNAAAGGIGFLIRGTGGTEAFGPNNADIPITGLSSGGEHQINVFLTPTATSYDVAAFADGSATPFFTYTGTTAFSNNFISLGGDQDNGFATVHTFDNLVIAVVPEPSSLLLGCLAAVGLFVTARRMRKS